MLTEGQRLLIADAARFDGVAVIEVDEQLWRHGGKECYPFGEVPIVRNGCLGLVEETGCEA